jgi:DNA replication protein DnaC
MGVMTMLSENTLYKLRKMKLGAMAEEYDRQMRDTEMGGISFDDRIGMIVDVEYSRRDSNRISRLIKSATFSERGACLENIDYSPSRKLDADTINSLSSCDYIRNNLNVRITGATGAGKTYLACALGMAACRNSYSVRYTNLQDMLSDLAFAREEGVYNKVFKTYRKVGILIIDDWMMFDVGNAEASILYNLIETRKYSGSLILCSQVGPEGWHGRFENKIVADSICDRLVNSSYKLHVEGEMRKKYSALNNPES